MFWITSDIGSLTDRIYIDIRSERHNTNFTEKAISFSHQLYRKYRVTRCSYHANNTSSAITCVPAKKCKHIVLRFKNWYQLFIYSIEQVQFEQSNWVHIYQVHLYIITSLKLAVDDVRRWR
jgi:hypothetical protein